MATRGSIPKMMEVAGIDMLSPEAGIPLIRRELTSGGTRGEVVIGQRLGILLNEWHSTGGLDPTAVQASEELSPAQGPMVGKIAGMGLHSGLTIETTLDPAIQPFLQDHQIEGTPVLPGVMGIEAFAEAAQSILPGWRIESVEEMNFLAPFKFYRGEPRTLTIEVVFHPAGDAVLADCQLIGHRTLPNHPEPQATTHFTGRVRLTKADPISDAPAARTPHGPAGAIVTPADIYRLYFHGPAYRVVARAWRDGEQIIGEFAQDLPDNHHPQDRPTLAAPRLIELCFQTAGLWEMGVQGRMGLPSYIHQARLLRAPERTEGRLYAVVTPDPVQGSFDAEVVDSAGNRYLQLSGYRTVALPNVIDAEPLKALNAVMPLEAVAT